MRTILIDDEPLALVLLQRQLAAIGGVDIVATYTDVREALASAPAVKPDVIFIDIMMPEINGMEAAERFLEQLPDTHLVFVTAHDDYAARAFELNAIDYVLKPAEMTRLRNTLAKIARILPASATPKAERQRPTIRCFQQLQIGDFELSWRTAKVRELFAFFVHRRNQIVRKDYLVETLWPDYEFKKAYTLLYSSIYHVRKTLASFSLDIALESTAMGYMLDLKDLPLDVDVWERSLLHAPPLSVATLDRHMELFKMYRGDYLAEYDYVWAEAERERLRMLWYQHALKLSELLGTTDRYEQAVDVNNRILRLFPFCEEAYLQLMKLYDGIGDRAAVHRYYEQLSRMLQTEFGTSPNDDIQAWYGNLDNRYAK